jgi:molybdopterin-guanine dinucleotide biosynthesis protein A
MSILGVVMAGGRNIRFGDIKAFADVDGKRIIDRVISALRSVTDDVVLSANDTVTYGVTGLAMRADVRTDLGPLGGIYTALEWALERGHDGIIAVACDMPFPSTTLLTAIARAAPQHDAVLPESGGRRGLEPLFAYYSVRCIPAINAAVARGDQRMIGFHDQITVHRLPLEEVRRHGDPEILFMNVNTPEDLAVARRIAAEQGL